MKTFKTIRTAAWNGLVVYLIWLAVHGHVNAGYCVKFVVISSCVLVPLAMVALSSIKVRPPHYSRLYAWINHAGDAGAVGSLVWHGWVGSGFLLFFCWILRTAIFDRHDNLPSKNKP